MWVPASNCCRRTVDQMICRLQPAIVDMPLIGISKLITTLLLPISADPRCSRYSPKRCRCRGFNQNQGGDTEICAGSGSSWSTHRHQSAEIEKSTKEFGWSKPMGKSSRHRWSLIGAFENAGSDTGDSIGVVFLAIAQWRMARNPRNRWRRYHPVACPRRLPWTRK